MQESVMNFILGPTKSGKTAFCHFISSTPLKITRHLFNFRIDPAVPFLTEQKIGNDADSETKFPFYYGQLCDFPGFGDTRGEENNLNTLIFLQNEIQKFALMRLVFVVEESYISTANGSMLINILYELISTFNLSESDTSGILILVTKTSEEFCSSIPDFFSDIYSQQFNFIIEAIKTKKIKVLPFEKPQKKGENYVLKEENREMFLKELKSTALLDCEKFRGRIYEKIENKLLNMRQEFEKYRDVVFTSKIRLTDRFVSEKILCIDNDLKLTQEYALFDAPIIVVLSQDQRKIFIEIEGQAPIINFSDSVKRVIRGEMLVVCTKNINKKIVFPDPTSDKFSMDANFYRLENICLNGKWTEYASHNNKFLDLIVYINPRFGAVLTKPEFKIKHMTIDLQLKFFVNECMRTKESIIKRFLSIRVCKDLDEYLEKSKKQNLPQMLREALETYVLKLPSIFQLFISTSTLNSFSGVRSEINDLLDMKGILVGKYLKLLNDFTNLKSEIKINDDLIEAFSKFQKFCRDNLEEKYNNLSLDNKKFLKGLRNFLNLQVEQSVLLDFFNFYDTLSISDQKSALFKYQITGDISNYINYQSLINKKFGMNLELDEFKTRFISLGNGIIVGAGISIGVGAGRMLLLRSTASIAARGGVGVVSVASMIFGAVMIIGDIGVNLVCALAKSGYYEGEYCPDARLYRLDI